VVLLGSDRLELEYVPPVGEEATKTGLFRVRLHEAQWRNRVAPQVPLSRKQMMVALRRVQAIYLRGTFT
jgi:hypothetical protein